MKKTIFFLLPAFNEEAVISELVKNISALNLPEIKIVLVDDGSSDGTFAEAGRTGRPNLVILRHKSNQGLGAAIKTGLDYVLDNSGIEDILITLDADGTHPVETAYLLLKDLESGSDCVIASRFVSGGSETGVNIFRKLLSRGVRILIRLIFGYPVNDFSSGFRAYRISRLRALREKYEENYVTEKGFACMAEILLKLLKSGAKVSEVPLSLRYDLKRSKSKIRVVKTILSYFKLFFRIKLQK